MQNVTNFGCFVALDGFRKKQEGLVHISQLRREGRVNRVEEVVNRGQAVKVKVLSIAGGKMSLSMKDADQETGEDLNPSANNRGARNREDDLALVNPERPTGKHNLADIIGRTQVGTEAVESQFLVCSISINHCRVREKVFE